MRHFKRSFKLPQCVGIKNAPFCLKNAQIICIYRKKAVLLQSQFENWKRYKARNNLNVRLKCLTLYSSNCFSTFRLLGWTLLLSMRVQTVHGTDRMLKGNAGNGCCIWFERVKKVR